LFALANEHSSYYVIVLFFLFMKRFLLVLASSAIFFMGMAQGGLLSGRVVDEDDRPLPGATLRLREGKQEEYTVSDREGRFSFRAISPGEKVIEVSFLGYRTYRRHLLLTGNMELELRMQRETRVLEEVMVNGSYRDVRARHESRDIEVVGQEYIRQNLSGSLMQSLDRLPGLHAMSIGSGQSKPVIRGLGFNRVVVTENGIKHEGQQWGEDHGLEIDQFAIDRVEVIKGPASLVYGSDAIGGVIDLRQTFIPPAGTIGGRVDAIAKSNNQLIGSSLTLHGRKHKWFFTTRFTRVDYADYRVPADSLYIYSYPVVLYKNRLRNTAGREMNGHFSVGFVGTRWTTRWFASLNSQEAGFFANAHGLEPRRVDYTLHDRSSRDIQFPRQEVQHLKLVNQTALTIGSARVELDLGCQHNWRQESNIYVGHGYMPAVFPDTVDLNSLVEREFNKAVWSANARLIRQMGSGHTLTSGLSMEYQANAIGGINFLIPAFHQVNWGAFVMDRWILNSRWSLNTGIRHDWSGIRTLEYTDWFPSGEQGYLVRAHALDKRFSSTTGSIGAVYSSGKVVARVNLGKGFRVPIAKELAANGVNYHHFRYEKGDSALSPEVSYQLDMALELNLGKGKLRLSPFLNYFPNYIYLNPTPDLDWAHGAGNQKFYYTGAEVGRWGGEISLRYGVIEVLEIEILGDYLYSQQLSGPKMGFTLPFSPPPSLVTGWKYSPRGIGRFSKVFVGMDTRFTARQTLKVPPEKDTPGHVVVNVSAGTVVRVGREVLDIKLGIHNLFNSRYLDHTSFYRLIGAPEPGRNFTLAVGVPFHFQGKN
jgi:iron complex outermembrane recepter protein